MRQCSGVVPVYIKDGKIYVVIVKSSNGKNWVFPKGGVESHLRKKENASKEAFEEAGIIVEPTDKLGTFEILKQDRINRVHMFYGRVTKVKKNYDEANVRERRIVSISKAYRLLDQYQSVFLKRALSHVKRNGK